MLPKKELNIYPKTTENLEAIISYYFDAFNLDTSASVDFLAKKNSFKINQIEFILSKISEGYLEVFRSKLKGTIKLTNLLTYGFEALTLSETDWTGAKTRIAITKEFRDFVNKSVIAYSRLEKSN